MKWRGQGLLTVAVLAAAAAIGWQWTSTRALEDHALGHGIDYLPYTRAVATFVDGQRRWPAAGELALPEPPDGGPIAAATLGPEGEIQVAFRAWTLGDGRVRAVLAPVLNPHAADAPPTARLSYRCVEVAPAAMARVVCGSETVTPRAEVAAANAGAFARWRHADAERQARQAIAAAPPAPTRCDRLWEQAEREILPCLEGVDPALARQFGERGRELFLGPRLRPEVVARNPELLAEFDARCQAHWDALAGTAAQADPRARGCF